MPAEVSTATETDPLHFLTDDDLTDEDKQPACARTWTRSSK